MDPTAESEDVVIQVKDKLQRDGVKLWLPPYHVENNGSSEDALKVGTLRLIIYALVYISILLFRI